ncbi:MAG: MBL fold metallo-hydrolase [Candidatus Humimicrobiaceae bacterium]
MRKIDYEGIPTYHDNLKGFLRGKNIIFKFEVDGIIFAHLCDLGHIPYDNVINNLLNVDILMIPLGGVFTMYFCGMKEYHCGLQQNILISFGAYNAA